MQLDHLSEAQYRKYYEARLQGRLLHKSGDDYTTNCPFHDDTLPSLAINTEKGVWICFAGCGSGGILQFERRFSSCDSETAYRNISEIIGVRWKTGRQPEAIYSYTDAFGKELFQVLRYKGKRFVQRRRGDNVEWIYKTADLTMVLYHLPDVVTAKHIIVVEGERDVDNLKAALGEQSLIAVTTSPRGAGKWRDEFSTYFTGKQVVVLPDNDEPGRKHGEVVATSVYRYTQQVKVLALPGLAEHGDVSDYLQDHTSANLIELVKAAPWWQPSAQPLPSQHLHLTDLGNAQRLIARHGDDLRYCFTWDRWLVWDDRRFKLDTTGEVERRSHDTALSIYDEAKREADPDAKEELEDHAKASESAGRLAAMLRVARSLPGVPVTPADMDVDPMLLNVRNGTIDLRKGELRVHDRADLLTKLIEIDYDPTAACPVFDAFLDKMMAGRKHMVEFLRRAIGYSLTASTIEQAIFIMHGTGANGKTTLIETVLALLGEYGKSSDSSLLLTKMADGVRNDVARLAGARFVSTSETEAGRRLAETLVKQLVGGDTITARFLFSEFFEFPSTFKIWLATNHKPNVKGTDHAIWRRIKLIPFNVTIAPEEMDKELPAKLRAELPGILAWAIRGCLEWQQKGLGVPGEVTAATADYREDQDFFGAFIQDRCIMDPEAETPSKELQSEYTSWCEESGYKKEANPRVLWTQLTDRGFKEHRDNRTRYRVGIRLARPAEKANNENASKSILGVDLTVTTVTNPRDANQIMPDQQLDLVTVKSDGVPNVTVTPPSLTPLGDGDNGDVTVTVAVTTDTSKILDNKHLQKSDGGDSERSPLSPPRAIKRLTGLQVIRLVEAAGGDLSLREDGTLRWSFPDVLVGTARERELQSLLMIHDREVRHILQYR
jgi:putative DNA primase/helicase